MNHLPPSDYLNAIMEAGFIPVESGELSTDLASVFNTSADGYREEPDETVTIVYEDDTHGLRDQW
jgi:hypothetical protein